MTPRISLITVVAAAFLVVAVPAAFGDAWGADRHDGTTVISAPDVVDRAVAARQKELQAQLGDATPPDAFDRAVAARTAVNETPIVGDGGDRFRIDPTSGPTPLTVGSGDDLEWPQIGFGVAIGILFALGLMLVLRTARGRQLAH